MTEYVRTAPLLENLEESRRLFDEFCQREFAALEQLKSGAESTKSSGLSYD